MSDHHRTSIMHNGAIFIDVDTLSWGEQPFAHEYFHFALVRRPLSTIELKPSTAQERLSMAESSILFVRPGDVDRVLIEKNTDDELRVSLAAFLFKSDLIKSTYGDLSAEGVRDIQDPVAAQLLMAAMHLDEKSDPLFVDHLCMAITARLRSTDRREIKNQGRIERVIAYVKDRLDQKLTLLELSGVAAMSSFHFVRTFRQVTGMTPLAYVMGARIDRAKAMLSAPGCSIVNIVAACGFMSQSHFSTVFKERVGVSPAAYRKILQK